MFCKTNTKYLQLSNGQKPEYVVIACSDSREVPEIITNKGLGEIFDIRVAGNVIDDYAIGSIEYAVEHLHVKKIIMLAHTKCGAVTAAQQLLDSQTHNKGSSCLDKLVDNIYQKIAKNGINRADLQHAIIDNARQQLMVLVNNSELIRRELDNGLSMCVALYNLENGTITFIDTYNADQLKKQSVASIINKHEQLHG